MKNPIALKAQQLVCSRLAKIRKGDLFNTDAGLYVELGPVAVTDERPYSLFIQFSAEAPQGGTGGGTNHRSFTMQRSFTVSGVIGVGIDCSRGEALEYLLADLKQALFLWGVPTGAHKELGQIVYESSRLVSRADGNAFEGFELTAHFTYIEGYGDPYAKR